MNALVMCIALVTAGIDVGWERRPEGGVEYIIQLDPAMLESLRAGETIESSKLPQVRDVRSWRILVGNRTLPREEPATDLETPSLPDPRGQPPTVPFALPPDPIGKPITEQPAAIAEPEKTDTKPEPKTTPDVQPEQPEQPDKPWLPLTLTIIGLFASIGANVYLGWIVWELRKRFQTNRAKLPPEQQ